MTPLLCGFQKRNGIYLQNGNRVTEVENKPVITQLYAQWSHKLGSLN